MRHLCPASWAHNLTPRSREGTMPVALRIIITQLTFLVSAVDRCFTTSQRPTTPSWTRLVLHEAETVAIRLLICAMCSDPVLWRVWVLLEPLTPP